MQNILAIFIGLAAFVYVIRIFIRQFSQSEKNPKCANCPIPDLQKSIKQN